MAHPILLVEDNPGDARLIEEYLKEADEDYVVEVASSIADAVSRVKEHSYEVVLTDLGLPDSDGLASVYKMLEAAPSTPLVVLTGNHDQQLAMMAVREGAQEFLVKDLINAKVLERVLKYSVQRHLQLNEARRLAFSDTLTGLPNRMQLLQTLRHDMVVSQRTKQALGVLFLDLDGFKGVNDTHGHEFGDAFLQAVACRLRHMLRASDTLARFGGDEFVIVQTCVDTTDSVVAFAEKLIRAFQEPLRCEGELLVAGLSVGIAMYPEHAHHAEELLTKADKALYEAKANGKGCFRFYTNN
ncbi:MAG: diguanylate cyclase [Proteobacteria bacterium]|nr:diguanylate cyclase [Pseudomonadota bacterium]